MTTSDLRRVRRAGRRPKGGSTPLGAPQSPAGPLLPKSRYQCSEPKLDDS